MSMGDFTNKFIVAPNTLRKLAGKEDELDTLEQLGSEYFDHVGDDTTSVEIITLTQHKYELAFDYIAQQEEFMDMSLAEMSDHVDSILYKFEHVVPHILVKDGEIIVVVNCSKIDTQIVEYASQLLSIIPCLEPGFRWEYLNPEN